MGLFYGGIMKPGASKARLKATKLRRNSPHQPRPMPIDNQPKPDANCKTCGKELPVEGTAYHADIATTLRLCHGHPPEAVGTRGWEEKKMIKGMINRYMNTPGSSDLEAEILQALRNAAVAGARKVREAMVSYAQKMNWLVDYNDAVDAADKALHEVEGGE